MQRLQRQRSSDLAGVPLVTRRLIVIVYNGGGVNHYDATVLL